MTTIPVEACAAISSNYIELNVAQLACALDQDCLSVVDEGCDQSGPFQLCKTQQLLGEENISRCIQSGKSKIGMGIFIYLRYSNYSFLFKQNLKLLITAHISHST